MRDGQGGWFAALLLGLAGCSAGAFACEENGQCTRDGAQGICEDVGFCSFADEGCEGGQRFGDLAGELAGACVPPGGGGSSGGSSASSLSTSVGTSTTGASPTTSSDLETTTGAEPREASSSTSEGMSADSTVGSETGTPPDATGESSTGDAPECATPFLELFDDGVLGAGWNVNPAGLTISELETQLRFEIPQGDESYGVAYRGPLDVSGGFLQGRISELPDAETVQLIFGAQTDEEPTHEHRFVIDGSGLIRAREGQADVASMELPPDTSTLDVLLDFETPGSVRYRYRVNAGAWVTLATIEVDTDVSGVTLRLLVGSWAPLGPPSEVVDVDSISGCLVDESD